MSEFLRFEFVVTDAEALLLEQFIASNPSFRKRAARLFRIAIEDARYRRERTKRDRDEFKSLVREKWIRKDGEARNARHCRSGVIHRGIVVDKFPGVETLCGRSIYRTQLEPTDMEATCRSCTERNWAKLNAGDTGQ